MVKQIELSERITTDALFTMALPMIKRMKEEEAAEAEKKRKSDEAIAQAKLEQFEAERAEQARIEAEKRVKLLTFQDSIAQIYRYLGLKNEWTLETHNLWYITVKTEVRRMLIQVRPNVTNRNFGAKEENYELTIGRFSPVTIASIRELQLPSNNLEFFDNSSITLYPLLMDTLDEAIVDKLQPTLDLVVAEINNTQETQAGNMTTEV